MEMNEDTFLADKSYDYQCKARFFPLPKDRKQTTLCLGRPLWLDKPNLRCVSSTEMAMSVSGLLFKRYIGGGCRRWMSQSESRTLSDKLWNDTEEIREKVLNTQFIQEIKTGKLNPVLFVSFQVQSTRYCHDVEKSLLIASETSSDPGLKEFLSLKAKRYKKYYTTLFHDTSEIKQGPLKQYSDILDNTATKSDPIYVVVACIPCTRLWPWIGNKLKKEKTTDFGCYTTWANEFFDPDRESYKDYENKVNDALKVDDKYASDIYTACMKAELDFFDSIKTKS